MRWRNWAVEAARLGLRSRRKGAATLFTSDEDCERLVQDWFSILPFCVPRCSIPVGGWSVSVIRGMRPGYLEPLHLTLRSRGASLFFSSVHASLIWYGSGVLPGIPCTFLAGVIPRWTLTPSPAPTSFRAPVRTAPCRQGNPGYMTRQDQHDSPTSNMSFSFI